MNVNSKLNYFIQAGREAVKEFRHEFPHIYSDSKSYHLSKNLDFFGNSSEFTQSVQYKTQKHLFNLVGNLRKEISKIDTKDYDNAIVHLKKLIKKYDAANCGECAIIIEYALKKKGIEAKNFTLEIIDSRSPVVIDHMFTVIGHRGGNFELEPREYLGESAVVVDAYQNSGLVMPFRKALEWFESFFRTKFTSENFFTAPARYNVWKPPVD